MESVATDEIAVGPVFGVLAGQPEVRAALSRAAWESRQWAAGERTAAEMRAHAESAVGAMTHAWLFTGPPGSGRTVAARAFAAALQCTNPDIVGCGRCPGCTTVQAGTHADVHFARTEGLSLGTQYVRDIVKRGNSRPVSGNFSIVIIEDADRLTEAAGNALLKVIEEPSGRALFILCAPSDDPADVMVTLRSRSRHVYLRTPSAEAVAEVLRADSSVPADMVEWAASVSGGHVGRARWLAVDSGTRARRERVITLALAMYQLGKALKLISAIVTDASTGATEQHADADEREVAELNQALGAGGTGKGAVAATRGSKGVIKELEANQKRRRQRSTQDALDLALVDIVGFYRDAIVQASGATVPLLHPDFGERSASMGRYYGAARMLRAVGAVQDAREALRTNVKPQYALAAMAGRVQQELNGR